MTPDQMLDAPVVPTAWVMKMDFLTAPSFVWTGRRKLIIGGQTYLGMGNVVSIDGLESAPGYAATPITVTLSGVKPQLLQYAQDASEFKGREFTVWECLFDENRQPIEPLMFRADGYMDNLAVSMPSKASRIIELTVESIWADRGQAAYATFSAADQKVRFPLDLGMEFQPNVAIGAQAIWPILHE